MISAQGSCQFASEMKAKESNFSDDFGHFRLRICQQIYRTSALGSISNCVGFVVMDL